MGSSTIDRKLSVVRMLDWLAVLFAGLVRVVAGLLLVGLVVFLVDYQVVRLPEWGRAVAWAVVAGSLGWLLLRYAVAPLGASRSEDQLALRVESLYSVLGGRLIAAVQLRREMDRWYSRGVGLIVEAVVRQAEALARPLRFGAVISRRPLYKTGGMLCAAAALMVLGLVFQGEQLSVFANRMMFGHRSYPARYRVIRVTPGDVANPTTVVRGESVGFEAEFRPYPATAWLELTDVHGRTTTLDMRETEKHVFTATVARVVDSFTYRVRGGDAVAEKDRSGRVYRIEARLRPVIKVGLDLRYPPYAGLTAAKVEGGSGEAIEGTRVQVNVELVQPAAIGGAAKKEIESIKLVYLSGVRALQEVPMKATSATSATLELPEPLQSSLRYTIWVKDKEGVTNYESIESQESPAPVFSLRAIADRPPKVAVTEPRTETVEVQDTLETVARAQAQDDYGILNVSLYWRVVPADYTQAESSKSQWHIEPLYQVGAASAPTRVSDLKAVISPKAMQAGVGDSVAFFVEARDHTAPAVLMPSLDMSKVPRGVGRSKEYTLVVIDEKTFKLRLHRQLTEVTQDFLRILGGWQGVDEKIEAPVAPPPEPKRDGAPQPKR